MAKDPINLSSFGILGELVENGRLAWRLLLDRRVPTMLKFVIRASWRVRADAD